MLSVIDVAGDVVRYVLCIQLALLGLSSVTHADEHFRCGQWVVAQGINVAELLKKCGEPTRKTVTSDDTWIRMRDGRMLKGPVKTTEIWTYERGSRQFPMIVTIVDGNIENMVSQCQ